MTNLATFFRAEISRLARRELRTEVDSLKKANGRYRSDIASLKRQVAVLEQQVKRLEKASAKASPTPTESPSPEGRATRFSAAGLKKMRDRLEISAPTLATILGVSAQSIYNWEAGTSRPGKDMVMNIAILRKMGKREVQQRLAAMKSAAA